MSFPENWFSTMFRLDRETIKPTGSRANNINLDITIPVEILLIRARLPAASRGITGISPTLAKLPRKEIKMSGIMPARITKIINGKFFENSSADFIERCITNHRINSPTLTIVIPIENFSPR